MSDSSAPSPQTESVARLRRALELEGGGFDTLYAAIQHELRRVARQQGVRLGARETLSTTALVNEAWFKLRDGVHARDDGHFLAIAARAMREILIDHARRGSAEKRGSGQRAEAPSVAPRSSACASRCGAACWPNASSASATFSRSCSLRTSRACWTRASIATGNPISRSSSCPARR
jgi:hypothetical protein